MTGFFRLTGRKGRTSAAIKNANIHFRGLSPISHHATAAAVKPADPSSSRESMGNLIKSSSIMPRLPKPAPHKSKEYIREMLLLKRASASATLLEAKKNGKASRRYITRREIGWLKSHRISSGLNGACWAARKHATEDRPNSTILQI